MIGDFKLTEGSGSILYGEPIPGGLTWASIRKFVYFYSQ